MHVFGGDFSFFKFDDGGDSNLDAFAGGQYTRNQPVHDSIVRKLVNGLFGENIFSDDLRDEYGLM